MTCCPSQTSFYEQYNQNNFHIDNHNHNSSLDLEMGPLTAQFILFTSLQKLDQAKRSRGGIRLRRGLLIAVTALKAKQLLWQQQDHYAQLKLGSPMPSTLVEQVPRSQTEPLSVSTTNSLYSLPNFTTSPRIDGGHIDSDQTVNYYSSPMTKKMDYDDNDSEYSTSPCVSGPPCFPPPSDELLQDGAGEENSYYHPTYNASPSKRFRLDQMLHDSELCSSTQDQSFPSSTPPPSTPPSLGHPCMLELVEQSF